MVRTSFIGSWQQGQRAVDVAVVGRAFNMRSK
jgi:hypothetical protein